MPSPANDPTTVQTKAQLAELHSINEEILRLSETLKAISDKTVAAQVPEKSVLQYSPFDRQAMASPIFLPGGAPKPLDMLSGTIQSNREVSNLPSGNADKSEASEADKADESQTSDNSSDSANPYDNMNNNDGGYYPYNSTSATFKASFSPASTPYNYEMATTSNDKINPLANVAGNNLTITLSGTSTSYYSISFCSADYTNCGDQQAFSNNAITLSSADTAISDDTKGGYVSTSITPSGASTSTNYWQGVIYAYLYSSSSDDSPAKVQFSFPAANCVVDESDASKIDCSLTSSTSSKINIVS